MTDKYLIKYQMQAAKLGLKNINAPRISVLLWNVVEELKSKPSAGKSVFTKQTCNQYEGVRYETTLYEYYTGMIRDTVKQIRQTGGRAYIFSVEQIADVIKYEKNAKFKY